MTIADVADDRRRLAQALGERSAEVHDEARRMEAGARGEAALCDLLGSRGWTYLHGRRRSTSRGDIDVIALHPGGIFVLDAKAWREPSLVGRRLYRGQDDCTDDVESVLAQALEVEATLADIGLPPLEVHPALVFTLRPVQPTAIGRVMLTGLADLPTWMDGRGTRHSGPTLREAREKLEESFPPYVERRGPAVAVARPAPRPRSVETGQLAGFDAVEVRAELDRACTLPIEQWMTWLHPAQSRYVRRHWNGPSRLRGAAGTGKSVVALHRAAYLAEHHPGRLLVTSFVKTLPATQRTLYRSLSPHTVERVDFEGLHSFALRVIADSGHHLRVNLKSADTGFAQAWIKSNRAVLERSGLTHDYWREEIAKVIKGRDVTTFEHYASLARVGRRTPIDAEQRRAAWDLYVDYQQRLDCLRIADFDDVLVTARDIARAAPLSAPYRYVIADEVQDLTMVGVQLVHAIVGDAADGLTLVGDGQQSIYPGGCTLREAGVAVTGRSVVFDVNYRNTREILEMATRVVEGDAFDDLEEVDEPGRRSVHVSREGPPVRVHWAPRRAELEAELVAQMLADRDAGVSLAGVAVLCRTNPEVASFRRVLRRAGIESVDLIDYDGQPSDRVKVGTIKRAKGLEFDSVFLPLLAEVAAGAEAESAQLQRREAFVAMTRARTHLWLGRLGAG